MSSGYKPMSLIQESLSVTTQTLFQSGTQIQMQMCCLYTKHALASIQRCQAKALTGSLCGNTLIVGTGFSSWARTSSGTAALSTEQKKTSEPYLQSGPWDLSLGPYMGALKALSIFTHIVKGQKVFSLKVRIFKVWSLSL